MTIIRSLPIFSNFLEKIQRWLTSIRASNPPVKLNELVMLLWSICKTRNSRVFYNEIRNLVTTLIRAKKVSLGWGIRHKLIQNLLPSNLHQLSFNCNKSYWVD